MDIFYLDNIALVIIERKQDETLFAILVFRSLFFYFQRYTFSLTMSQFYICTSGYLQPVRLRVVTNFDIFER